MMEEDLMIVDSMVVMIGDIRPPPFFKKRTSVNN
jgi:hypothetical protein